MSMNKKKLEKRLNFYKFPNINPRLLSRCSDDSAYSTVWGLNLSNVKTVFSETSRPTQEITQPLIQWALSVKRARRDMHHAPPQAKRLRISGPIPTCHMCLLDLDRDNVTYQAKVI